MYLLLGYGKSNKSIEKYLINKNIEYMIYDDKNCNYSFNKNFFSKIKIIIKSNGIKNNHPILEEARERQIKIISDLQYFYEQTNRNDYCLVTGSNGKTTIVSLLEKCLNKSISIGNNGLPFFDKIDNDQYKILEVSSFMLENINYIKYKYNIISNIHQTHLEHHGNFINYIKSKISFIKYLDIQDNVIYDKDDILLNRLIECYEVNKISVSLNDSSAHLYLKDKFIYYKKKKVLDVSKLQLIGNHNIYNVMLVLGVILNNNLIKENYLEIIYNYKGEKFRMEMIYDGNFKIINDSKSTNFKALNVALDSFKDNIVLIVGGNIRNDDYNLINKHLNKINRVYCYGENKDYFYNYFNINNITVTKYKNLNDLIDHLMMNNGEILLFSPGSISYDQFKDFEERGNVFNKLIKNKYFF